MWRMRAMAFPPRACGHSGTTASHNADRRGNLPKTRADQKIDAAVARIVAIGGAMVEDEDQVGPEVFSRTIATTTRRALDPKWGRAISLPECLAD